MREDLIEVWNVGEMGEERAALINATSNALERYNRRLNEKMGLHPNLVVFASMLEEVSRLHLRVFRTSVREITCIYNRAGVQAHHPGVRGYQAPSHYSSHLFGRKLP